jgi:hypothetical protein
MKPVHIEFIENTRWRWVWGGALVVGGCLLAYCVWRAGQISEATQQEGARIAAAQTQLELLRTPAPTVADPRSNSNQLAAQLLQLDLNKAFATIENLQAPGARLRGLTLDATANTLRLEYELDAVDKASTVTEALNTGYESRPWQLESVSAAAPPVFRAQWVAQLKKL